MTTLAIGGLGTPELLIILAVIILLFGASKLPELARGSGRALRIFKAETKGLEDDDVDDATSTPEQREIRARQARIDADVEADRRARERRDDTTA
jgi:sec-independent protein translocase protein TatA